MYSRFFRFITLPSENGVSSTTWKTDLILRNNILLYIENYPGFAEFSIEQLAEFLLTLLRWYYQFSQVAIFLKGPDTLLLSLLWIMFDRNWNARLQWEPKNRKHLVMQHLRAYCELNCYYAAQKSLSNNSSLEHRFDLLRTNFGIARELLYNQKRFIKLLINYNNDIASLGTYVQASLNYHINWSLSEAYGHSFSPWRLLYKASYINLKAALLHKGYNQQQTGKFILAVKYFRPIYHSHISPTIGSGLIWSEPTQEIFHEAANVYNSNRPQEDSVSLNIDDQEMAWMQVCINALREYRNLYRNSSTISLEELPHEVDSSLFFEAEEEDDRHELYLQINNLGRKQLIFLTETNQKILISSYDFEMKQVPIAVKFKVHQTTISHCLKSFQVKLLKNICELVNHDIDEYFIRKIYSIIREYVEEVMKNVLNVITKQVCANLDIAWVNRSKAENIDLVLEKCLIILRLEKQFVQQACATLGINWKNCYNPLNIHQVLEKCLENLTLVREGIVQEACANLDIAWKNRSEPSNIYHVFQECLIIYWTTNS